MLGGKQGYAQPGGGADARRRGTYAPPPKLLPALMAALQYRGIAAGSIRPIAGPAGRVNLCFNPSPSWSHPLARPAHPTPTIITPP